MKKLQKFLVAMVIALSIVCIANYAKADDAPPAAETAFYFQKDGEAVTGTVKFTVLCYGHAYNRMDDTYSELYKMSEFSDTCHTYGCKFDTTGIFQPSHQQIQYCNLNGEINNKKFTIYNVIASYPSSDLQGMECRNAFDIYGGNQQQSGYYKETTQYNECKDAVKKEYSDTDKCLNYCSWSPIKEGESCHITDNGKCCHETKEYEACTNEWTQKDNACDQYLKDVTATLDTNKDGITYDQLCEAKINIPIDIPKSQLAQIQEKSDDTQGDSSQEDQASAQPDASGNPVSQNQSTGQTPEQSQSKTVPSNPSQNLSNPRNISSLTYGEYFIISLLLTLIVELLMLFIVSRYLLKIQLPKKEIMFWGILANLFSLPYLWFVFPLFMTSYNYILIGEVLVVLIETVILSKGLKVNLKNAFIMSLIANVASYLIGIILMKH